MNALAGQRFDEKMAAQVEVESKQLKVLAEKIKVKLKSCQIANVLTKVLPRTNFEELRCKRVCIIYTIQLQGSVENIFKVKEYL